MKKTFGARIRALRIKNRLTREQVVSILAIPLEQYVGLEEGRFQPEESIFDDFINLYGCDRSYLSPKPTEIRELSLKTITRDKSDDRDDDSDNSV